MGVDNGKKLKCTHNPTLVATDICMKRACKLSKFTAAWFRYAGGFLLQ